MKCRKCGQEIESSARFCPECGAAVTASVKTNKPLAIFFHILKGFGIWFALVLLIAFIGTELNLADRGETISTLYSLIVAILPIYLAVILTEPRKPKNTSAQRSAVSPSCPEPQSVPAARVAFPEQTIFTKTKPKENKTLPNTSSKKEVQYVINPTTMVIHRANCRHAANVYTSNKHYVADCTPYIEYGYRPCKYCKPR